VAANDLDGVTAVILGYFTEVGTFEASYVTVVNFDPYCLPHKYKPKNAVFAIYDFACILRVY